MPTFTIRGPDGRTVRVAAPNQEMAIRQARQSLAPSPPPTIGSMIGQAARGAVDTGAQAIDAVRQIADPTVSIRRGVNFMADGANSIADIISRALSDEKGGRPPPGPIGPRNLGLDGLRTMLAPQGAQLAAAPFTSKQPNNEPERIARAAGNFLPNAFLGEGGAVPRIASVLSPALASEGARRLTQASGAGPLTQGVAQIGGGMLGTMAPSMARSGGAMASELIDSLDRARNGRTPADQARWTSAADYARGQAEAVRRLRQMGVTPERIEQGEASLLGKPLTTAEAIGPSGVSLAQGIRGRAGTTGGAAQEFLRPRVADRPERVLYDTHQATGMHPLAVLGDLGQILEQNRQDAAPLFQEAYRLPPPNSDRLDQHIVSDAARRYWGPVAELADREGRDPETRGYAFDENGASTPVDIPSVRTLETLKDQLDGQLEGVRGPLTDNQQAARRTADGLRASLTSAIPSGMAYSAALDAGGDLPATEAALRNAQGKLLAADPDPSRFRTEFLGLQPFEQVAAKAAAAGDLANLAYNPRFDSSALAEPHVQQKLRFLFGPQGAEQLANSFGAESSMADFEQPPSGPAGLAQRLAAAARAPINMAGRNALGDLLYQDPSASAQAMRWYGAAPNAFVTGGLRMLPSLQYGRSLQGASPPSSGQDADPSQS
jgi:hypothetical protein